MYPLDYDTGFKQYPKSKPSTPKKSTKAMTSTEKNFTNAKVRFQKVYDYRGKYALQIKLLKKRSGEPSVTESVINNEEETTLENDSLNNSFETISEIETETDSHNDPASDAIETDKASDEEEIEKIPEIEVPKKDAMEMETDSQEDSVNDTIENYNIFHNKDDYEVKFFHPSNALYFQAMKGLSKRAKIDIDQQVALALDKIEEAKRAEEAKLVEQNLQSKDIYIQYNNYEFQSRVCVFLLFLALLLNTGVTAHPDAPKMYEVVGEYIGQAIRAIVGNDSATNLDDPSFCNASKLECLSFVGL